MPEALVASPEKEVECFDLGFKLFDSLSSAMRLTTIRVCPPKYVEVQFLIFKENWTSGDVLGHAADVWGSRGREFKSRQPDIN